MSRSQLTGETSSRASGTFSYGYDGGTSTGPGNPTSFKGHASTFNADNQVTGTGYGYDGNGSPTAYKSSTLTFDPEQRLTGYNGSTQTDAYDGDGLRTWKQTDSDGDGSLRTYFLYDGSQPVVEEDSSGGFYASNTFGADGLVSRFPGESLDIVALDASDGADSSEFYTFDERGDVSERVNTASTSGGPKGPAVSGTSGSSVSAVSEVYDAYGSRTAQSPQPEPWGYGAQAGYYTDLETGLILCTHRFYDPSNGRWLTRDPIGYRGGVNLYGYVGNDPGNYGDISGERGQYLSNCLPNLNFELGIDQGIYNLCMLNPVQLAPTPFCPGQPVMTCNNLLLYLKTMAYIRYYGCVALGQVLP